MVGRRELSSGAVLALGEHGLVSAQSTPLTVPHQHLPFPQTAAREIYSSSLHGMH